jgi:hypothetical protein
VATEIIKEFALSNDARQSFTFKAGTLRVAITIYTQNDYWAFDMINADTDEAIILGRAILHGNDLFKYTPIQYELRYIHELGVGHPRRETLNGGVLYLAAPI